MRYNFLKKTAIWVLISFLVFPANRLEAASPIPISAPSAILLDGQNHRVLFSKTPHQKRAPASTTKILTAILAVEHLNLNQVITIPAFAESIEPSKIHLRKGERYYVRDLVEATLISSANDAAEVLGWAVAGSQSKFSTMMTQKAHAIGAKRSRFVRGSGLPAKGQYSTAYDMALIVRYAQRYPFIVKTLKTKKTSISSLGGRKIYLKNHNKMLWRDSREVIGKTGWTRKARHCFVGQIQSQGRKVFVALMGSQRLWRDLKALVDYQFGKKMSRVRENQKIWAAGDIKKIQAALRKSGYNPGEIDGKFGPRTVGAVEQFQKAHGLRVDGIVGKNTWSTLQRYM